MFNLFKRRPTVEPGMTGDKSLGIYPIDWPEKPDLDPYVSHASDPDQEG